MCTILLILNLSLGIRGDNQNSEEYNVRQIRPGHGEEAMSSRTPFPHSYRSVVKPEHYSTLLQTEFRCIPAQEFNIMRGRLSSGNTCFI